jgi:diguanylate cyclase (GGDEF)-like protein
MPAMTAQLLRTASYAVLVAATLVDNVRLFGEVKDRAVSDSLTGLANYRQFLDVLQNELERFGRTNHPFCILLLDLDGLKEINDSHGHTVGTRAICRVAEVLRLHSRAIDTAARYGGDEFGLILPETDAKAAQQVSRRLRQNLGSDGELPRLSVAVGIAMCPQNGASVRVLLDAADRDLYSAKALSRKSKSSQQLTLKL